MYPIAPWSTPRAANSARATRRSSSYVRCFFSSRSPRGAVAVTGRQASEKRYSVPLVTEIRFGGGGVGVDHPVRRRRPRTRARARRGLRWRAPHAVVRARGHPVVAVERDVSGVADLARAANIEIVEHDLEDGSPWPFAGQAFAAIVV